MSLEKITARLYSDTERECAEIIRKATEEAQNIVSRAETEANELKAAEKESTDREAKTILEKARSTADASERRALLAAKSDLIATVLSSAKERLRSLETDKYFDVLLTLANRNKRDDKGIMYLSADDLKRVPSDFAEKLGEKITVSDTPVKTDGGFVLKYGDIEINCTFGALFGAYSDELKAKASEVLFG